MTKPSGTCVLSQMAQTIVINLEQTKPKEGETIVILIAKLINRCPVSLRGEVGAALEELTECGYAEARVHGFSSASSAIFYHRLLRKYRLTPKGHDWHCENWDTLDVLAPHH